MELMPSVENKPLPQPPSRKWFLMLVVFLCVAELAVISTHYLVKKANFKNILSPKIQKQSALTDDQIITALNNIGEPDLNLRVDEKGVYRNGVELVGHLSYLTSSRGIKRGDLDQDGDEDAVVSVDSCAASCGFHLFAVINEEGVGRAFRIESDMIMGSGAGKLLTSGITIKSGMVTISGTGFWIGGMNEGGYQDMSMRQYSFHLQGNKLVVIDDNPSIIANSEEYIDSSNLPAYIITQMDNEFKVHSVEFMDFNNDGYKDIFITKVTGYPAYYHYVFLKNENNDGKYTNISPEDGLSHPNNNLRFNSSLGEFCSEYHGYAIPGIKESGMTTSVDIYRINGYQKMTREALSSEQTKNSDRDNLYCNEEKGWRIISGF